MTLSIAVLRITIIQNETLSTYEISLSIDTQHNGTQNNNNAEFNTQQNNTSETVL